jgi:hypothetical protein
VRLKTGDVVCILWRDQNSYEGPTAAEGALQRCFGQSVGVFLEQDSKWITIASERFETDRVMYRHVMTFPKCAVINVQRLATLKRESLNAP